MACSSWTRTGKAECRKKHRNSSVSFRQGCSDRADRGQERRRGRAVWRAELGRRCSARRTCPRPEFRQRRLVGPREPFAGIERDGLMVLLERNEVLERRDAVELGGGGEAHEYGPPARARAGPSETSALSR